MAGKFKPEELQKLNKDSVFQKRVSEDKLLNKLFSERDIDQNQAETEALLYLGGLPEFHGVVLRQVSPRFFYYLGYFLKSPLLRIGEIKKITPADIDCAMYLLGAPDNPMQGISRSEKLKEAAFAFCAANEIDYEEALNWLFDIINISFAYTSYLPEHLKSNKPCDYDCEWLASVTAQVSNVSNLSPEEIENEISMVKAGYLTLEYLKKCGVRGIQKHTKAEDCMARLNVLMRERLGEMEKENNPNG